MDTNTFRDIRTIKYMIGGLLNSMQSLITLSPAEVDVITSLFKEKKYKKGDFFLEEGEFVKKWDSL